MTPSRDETALTDKVTPPAAPGGTALDPGRGEPTKESHPTSIAVWGVPSPVVVSRRFAAAVGVKCSAGCSLGGRRVVIRNAAGTEVGHARVGETPEPGTSALYAAKVTLEAPADEGVHAWTAAFDGAGPDSCAPHDAVPVQDSAPGHANATATFGFRTTAPPEHRVTVTVVDRDTETRVAGAEVRVGVYRGTTDASGQAHVAVHPGSYDLYVRKAGYKPHADSIPVVSGDVILKVAAVRVTDGDLDDEQVWM